MEKKRCGSNELNSKSLMPKSNIIYGSTDWNTINDPGVYKVQTEPFQEGMHTPLDDGIDIYTYGILIVICAKNDSENRKVQIYIPDTQSSDSSKRIAYRTYNYAYKKWLYINFIG